MSHHAINATLYATSNTVTEYSLTLSLQTTSTGTAQTQQRLAYTTTTTQQRLPCAMCQHSPSAPEPVTEHVADYMQL
eukprot:CAMPEP_0181224556 /NCGR_PEP_ID=MMETSP1096-20121128/31195_1 /TAXON_ID=156174 ORGANISM="Chrysochromulina ericina, Strain CCMP281" /NCGR_SAMPLE_ID=MMETSP1096 /ASSEMBLY_ACC=CAM_ASM_000453 /LENGTH=76 /DNA_ID=CAMNT_0023317657 /DNA_START=21 /DNA_END=251 /DNA_ORIENTATION=+